MKRFGTLLIILVFVTGGLLFLWNRGLQAPEPKNKASRIFVINPGSSVRIIANSLKKEGLIKDPIVFFLLVKKMGLDNKIQAGDFRLSPSMNANDLALALTHGTLDIWVTVPEGKRADEIADALKEKIPSYKSSWRTILGQNEGYLFPDTYLIPRDATITIVVNQMRGNFNTKFKDLNSTNSKLTKEQLVIVASLVEREARLAEDRPLVASVIINRFEIGMPLQIDATIQYALGYQDSEKTWWKKELTRDDLKLNSPYNTYLHAGFPPTPISNPGLSVLQAVANPASTDYLYYVSDKSGKNHYAKTLDEHNANIKKYGL